MADVQGAVRLQLNPDDSGPKPMTQAERELVDAALQLGPVQVTTRDAPAPTQRFLAARALVAAERSTPELLQELKRYYFAWRRYERLYGIVAAQARKLMGDGRVAEIVEGHQREIAKEFARGGVPEGAPDSFTREYVADADPTAPEQQ